MAETDFRLMFTMYPKTEDEVLIHMLKADVRLAVDVKDPPVAFLIESAHRIPIKTAKSLIFKRLVDKPGCSLWKDGGELTEHGKKKAKKLVATAKARRKSQASVSRMRRAGLS